MIGKVPWGAAGTSPILAIGMFLMTEVPTIGAEAAPSAEIAVSVEAEGR